MLVARHHTNWRLKSIEKTEKEEKDELIFTAPLTVSQKDFKKIKNILLNSIEKVSEIIVKTSPEKVTCLNIDLFYVQ